MVLTLSDRKRLTPHLCRRDQVAMRVPQTPHLYHQPPYSRPLAPPTLPLDRQKQGAVSPQNKQGAGGSQARHSVPEIRMTGTVKVSSKLWQNVRLKSPVTSCVCPSFSRLYVCLVLCVSVLVSVRARVCVCVCVCVCAVSYTHLTLPTKSYV